MIDSFVNLNWNISQKFMVFVIDDGNIVVGGIRNIRVLVTNSDGVWTCPANNFHTFNILADLVAGFDLSITCWLPDRW